MTTTENHTEQQVLRIVKTATSNDTQTTPAIDCGKDFDVQGSLERMAAFRGQGGVSEFDRGVELRRVRGLLKDGDWGKYLSHPAVDVKERWAQTLMTLAGMDGGRELCLAYGVTPTLQLYRIKDREQRDAFVAQYPPAHYTVAELRALVDRVLGHQANPRKTIKAVRVDHRVVWAAGVLYLDTNTLTPASVQEQYERLRHIFARGTDGAPLRETLDAARTILNGEPTADAAAAAA